MEKVPHSRHTVLALRAGRGCQAPRHLIVPAVPACAASAHAIPATYTWAAQATRPKVLQTGWREFTHYLARLDFHQIAVFAAVACAVGFVCLLLGFRSRSKY